MKSPNNNKTMGEPDETELPPSSWVFQGVPLINIKGDKISAEDALKDKVVGVFFSAGWCPASRDFTPLLTEVYDELKSRGAPFEVVFVSCDKSESAMQQFMQDLHGDWLAVPFGNPHIGELKEKYDIIAVPKLLILSPDDSEVISMTGRKEVQSRGVVCFNSWVRGTQYANKF